MISDRGHISAGNLRWRRWAVGVFKWLVVAALWSLISLLLGNGAALYMNLVAIREDDRSELLGSALLIPLYWLMMSVAAIKGMWQILVNPSYWEKTFHGLSTSSSPDTDPDGQEPT